MIEACLIVTTPGVVVGSHFFQWITNPSFAQPPFLLNSGHCEEWNDKAILWIIKMLWDCFARAAHPPCSRPSRQGRLRRVSLAMTQIITLIRPLTPDTWWIRLFTSLSFLYKHNLTYPVIIIKLNSQSTHKIIAVLFTLWLNEKLSKSLT